VAGFYAKHGTEIDRLEGQHLAVRRELCLDARQRRSSTCG
jgi:hypothetical protein